MRYLTLEGVMPSPAPVSFSFLSRLLFQRASVIRGTYSMFVLLWMSDVNVSTSVVYVHK